MPLLALILLLAQEGLPPVPPRMPVDEAPTAMACTFDAVLADKDCTYEAAGGPGDARHNSKAAAEAGLRACAREARRDGRLRKECENAVAKASLGPQCAVEVRLADDEGRLTWDAQDCVDELRLAIHRAARSAALSAKCCTCLEEAHCSVPAAQCRSELDSMVPGAALHACLGRSCGEVCPLLPSPRQPENLRSAPTTASFNRPDKI